MLMKLNQILEEMIEIAKNIGVTVRKEKGKFKSASCEVKTQKLIILNRDATLETMSSALAIGLAKYPIDNLYIKPAIREYIEIQIQSKQNEPSFELEVDY